MKVLSSLLIFMLLLISCSTTTTEEQQPIIESKEVTVADMVKNVDQPIMVPRKMGSFSNNEIVTFTSTLDSKAYLESVSAPDNIYTLYNEMDLVESYSFIDKEINSSQVNEENISYNYIVKSQELESLTIESDVPYMLTLSSASINAKTTPAIILKGEGKCFLNIEGNVSLSDSIDNNKKGVITAEGDELSQVMEI